MRTKMDVIRTKETLCNSAAESGHLECLKYAHENGCHWTYFTCIKAVSNRHFNCFKYAHENGCPGSARLLCNLPPAYSRVKKERQKRETKRERQKKERQKLLPIHYESIQQCLHIFLSSTVTSFTIEENTTKFLIN